MNSQAFQITDKRDESHQKDIYREQVRDLYSSIPLTTGLVLSGASIMTFLVWSLVNFERQIEVLIWLGLFTLLAVVRMGNFMLYSRHENLLEKQDRSLEPHLWAHREVLMTTMYGVLFGGFFLVFYDADNYSLFYQMQMATFLFCMILASASFLTSHLPSYISLSISSASIVLVRLLSEGDWIHLSMIPVVIAFNVIVFNFVDRQNRTFKESIQARFQDLDLIQILVEKKEFAERSNVEKSKFIAAAGHDLRQPLHAISICATNLEAQIEGDSSRQMLSTINQSVAELNDMLNTLTDILRFDAGDITSAISHFSLQEIHQQIALEYKKYAEIKGLKFSIDVDELYVKTDQKLYGVILRNLISNAINFTEQGLVCVKVTSDDDYLKVEITDTGNGISDEIQSQLCSKTYQLNNSNRDRTNGLGLGLSLVYRLTDLLGIQVTLHSNAQEGSRFCLRLPVGHKGLAGPQF